MNNNIPSGSVGSEKQRQDFEDLLQVCRYRAKHQGNTTGFTFLKDGETASGSLTFAELDSQARALGSQLQAVAEPGDRALLLFEPGLDFIVGFFACIYAGVIAVPAFPPRANQLHFQRLESIATDACASVVLTADELNERVVEWLGSSPSLSTLKLISAGQAKQASPEQWKDPRLSPQDIAFIQYTSGSTGNPKGVLVSHGNLICNEQRIAEAFEHDEQTVVVGWLPQYHDMGLIGNLLQPLYLGCLSVLMSPRAFLQKPSRWLQAISDYRATTSGGPNFAYDLCIRSISEQQKSTLDLSCWKVAFNGSEVVRAETMARFVDAFGACGFADNAFFPCYGMAESTLFTTSVRRDEKPLTQWFDAQSLQGNRAKTVSSVDDKDKGSALHLASSGKTRGEDVLCIVNPQTRTLCQPGSIGEIWFSSPSVCQGYWQKPELSEAIFEATVEGDQQHFLRTGDLGFLYRDELFVTGRLKELIIIRGRNHYPQDIEKTIQDACEALVPGGGAAFAIDFDGEERLVVVQEVQRTYLRKLDEKAVFTAARSAVFENHELQLFDLVLIKPSRVPKTSSGKIKRKECHDRYINNDMAELAEICRFRQAVTAEHGQDVEPSAAPEAQTVNPMLQMLQYLDAEQRAKAISGYLQSLLAQLLKCPAGDIDLNTPVSGLGIDSLLATEFLQRAENEMNLHFDLDQVLDSATLTSLGELASTEHFEAAGQAAVPPSQTSSQQPLGQVPALAHNQQALWFLHQLSPQSSAYNLALPLRIRQPLDESLLDDVVHRLVARHPVLASRFELDDQGAVKVARATNAVDLTVVDVAGVSEPELKQTVQQWVNKPFDLKGGNVMRTVLFNIAQDKHVLLFCTHHIVSDLWSMQLLLRDFCQLYSAALKSQQPQLPLISAGYEEFVHWQHHWLGSEDGFKAREYWMTQLSGVPPVLNLPLDHPRPKMQGHQAKGFKFALSTAISQDVAGFAKAHQVTQFVALLSAFQVTMKLFSGQQDICTGVPSSGRSQSRFADVVGYFVSPLAVRTQISASQTLAQCVNLTRRQVLDALPHQHFPLHAIVDELCAERDPSVNPLYQTWFQLELPRLLEGAAPLLLGDEADIEMLGLKLGSYAVDEPGAKLDLALTLVDLGERLSGRWVYNAELFEPETIERFHNAYEAVLEAMIRDADTAIGEIRLPQDSNSWGRKAPLEGRLFHQWFEQRAQTSPDQPAVVCGDEQMSAGQVNLLSNRLARYLTQQGVAAGTRVGVCVPRSHWLIIAQLAVLKAGGAFVPLDPGYPRERLNYIVEDAELALVLTMDECAVFEKHIKSLDILRIDSELARLSGENLELPLHPQNLAYLIYTSGSTGRPKGVMITHANIENFFQGMDEALDEGDEDNKTWLAVTSSSFDISMLELFWSLSRGYKVVVQEESTYRRSDEKASGAAELDFSLFFFADDNSSKQFDCYELMLESAKFADDNDFQAVWLPERHFHTFGGQYANPSVAAAAVAATTRKIGVRAGSVVVPLHDPIRIAEEWSMVDNLSKGRVAMSITPGWNPNDFALNPQGFEDRHQRMYDAIDQIQQLWQGGSIRRENGRGEQIEVSIFPKPVQSTLPVWLTAAGHPDTFKTAGKIGANLLTHLLGQNIKELKEKLDLYRAGRAEAGLDPQGGHITLMMHSFVAHDVEYAMDRVEVPFKSYLRNSIGLMKPLADKLGIDFRSQQDLLVEQGFQRYSTTSALFGTPESCLPLVNEVKAMGVNEIACLIDFGVSSAETLDNLRYLAQLRKMAQRQDEAQGRQMEGAAQLLKQHEVTHLQCTPSFARMLLQDCRQHELPLSLRKMLIGGEAFPTDLVAPLAEQQVDALYNMYGPTETTIWSSVAKVYEQAPGTMTLGQAIDNTGLYVLNDALQQVPCNVEGQLYISGLGLARGYWQRPDLTAERFLPDPYSATPGSLMYCTGDIVKRRTDGELVYLGRCDDQVKINGFRIELGEIESVLLGHEHIEQAVVIAEDLAGAAQRLKVYLVTDDEQLRLTDVRQFVARHLPGYMVPSLMEVVPAMPLTPNGKVDRKALKQLQGTVLSATQGEFVKPQTPLQQQLADIWMELLDIDSVSIHCNFFALGGHSLLATRLVTLLQEQTAVGLMLQDIFVNPSIAELAYLIESRQAQGLKEEVTSSLLPPLVPDTAHRFEPFPLTEVQQAYWLGRGDNFEMGNISTHVYFEFALPPVDIEQLSRGWQSLIRRHDMLRVIFLDDGTQQVLESTPEYRIALEDVSGQGQQMALEQVREELSHQVLDTGRWPLFDIRVSRCDERDILHISMDVLIADGLSTVKLFREWSQLYRDPQTQLEPIEVTFRDCVLAEQALKKTSQYENARQYWLSRLDDIPAAPELPLAKSPSALTQPRFVRRSFHLVKDKWEQLQSRAKQHGLTPSGILIGAFAEVLTEWSKHPQFTINLTLFNRLPLHRQIDDLVGDFTSLTLLSVDNREPLPFVERALATQKELWQDLDHRLFNGVEVLRELAKARGRSSASMPVVFTSALGLGSVDGESAGIDNLGEFIYGISQTPQVWLDHQVMEYQGGLLFNWDVVEELFPEGVIPSMFDAYVEFLLQLTDSDQAWHQPDPSGMLPEPMRQMLDAVNQTEVTQSDRLMQTLFIEQVAKTPDNPAVIASDKTLSYRRLEQYAVQVAQALSDNGVKPGDIVAVSMDKSWQQVVAVYGVLFAGGAYVPIDPELPQSRIAYLLEQTAAGAVLIQSKNRQRGLWGEQVPLLAVDELLNDAVELPLPMAVRNKEDLAYIIFTSGSTGVPKGVMIDHQGAVNTLEDINRRFNVQPEDRVLALSSLSFDLSVYDIFGVLATGAAVVMPDPEGTKEPSHWLELIKRHQVSLWNSVPALMQMLVEYIDGDLARAQAPLRLAMLSGDWIPLKLPSVMKQLWPRIETISLGGATEASIWSIFHPIGDPDRIGSCIPYGKPLDNQKFFVYNPHFDLCPVWVAGELYIGGIGLAQGYWKDEEKTSAAFVRHPHSGERLYRTGDMGRYLPDGSIEFLGREDSQVKINGFRVELGEIERTIQQHPQVKEAVVVAYGERSDKQLAAYFTMESSGSPEENGQVWFAEFSAEQLRGVLTDPIERAAFKLERRGLRHYGSDVERVESDGPLHLDEVTYLSRQSYREFGGDLIGEQAFCLLLGQLHQFKHSGETHNEIFLWCKQDAISGVPEGAYRYDFERNRLMRLASSAQVTSDWFGPNSAIYERAGFALLVVGHESSSALVDAGALGQLLMDFGPEVGIGFCPIGRVTADLASVFPVSESCRVLHSLVGGAITNEQRQRWLAEQPMAGDKIAEFLAGRLPAYMVPNCLMPLEQMPLTDNGKVNRKALPEPKQSLATNATYTAPTTDTEQQLAEIYAELLGMEKVGIHDNFFDVGGNSLTVAQLNSRIRERFGIELPLRKLFDMPTVAGLASVIAVHLDGANDIEVPNQLDDDMERMEF